ncbi:MAG TPA: HlyD family efflux transporter periplasmic adaptor subunit [Burkholderiaceae bacterium]|nr:HlyD family efflux transporter periplasmic adaptor subunit [Burkholderiaceae bacterium]
MPDSTPESPSRDPIRALFRQEAIDAQRDKLFGEVSLVRPVPLWVFTCLALTCAIGLIVFLVRGEYARRERVDGFLELNTGAAKLQVPEAGTIAELYVKEGAEVAMGSPIARITFDRSTTSGSTASELVAREMNTRMTVLTREQEQARLLGAQQSEQLRKRMDDLRKELVQFDREIKLQQQRVQSAQELFDRYKRLAHDRFVSDLVAQQRRDDVIDQQVKLESLRRQRSVIERDLRAAQAEEPTILTKARAQVDSLQRELSTVQQGLVEREAQRETIIRAPMPGTVTNIALSQGQSVSADTAVATVVPTGSALHAELLVPTRAIGFIQPGQVVVLRYEAFPFQRFGQHRGKVMSVGRTVWSAGERVGPIVAREPVYRVDVELDQQIIVSNNQSFPLRVGMLVNADILLERRRVIEWLFEPVLGLRERFR